MFNIGKLLTNFFFIFYCVFPFDIFEKKKKKKLQQYKVHKIV